jgi:sugar/nucleoside kinase (ribokinase family)
VLDICLIGHVSWDTVVWQGRAGPMQPGSTAFHAAIALGELGASAAVITAVARADADTLLAPLREAGITVFNLPTEQTAHSRNDFLGSASHGEHRQWLTRAADPVDLSESFLPEARAYHLCGLLDGDIAPATLERLNTASGLVSTTAAPFLIHQPASDGALTRRRPESGTAHLTGYDLLQASATEITVLTDMADPMQAAATVSTQGVGEIVVTHFDAGAFVLAEGRGLSTAISTPTVANGPAGLDDAFFAAYLWRRLRAEPPREAADYAGIVASLRGNAGHAGAVVDDLVSERRQQGSDLFHDRG